MPLYQYVEATRHPVDLDNLKDHVWDFDLYAKHPVAEWKNHYDLDGFFLDHGKLVDRYILIDLEIIGKMEEIVLDDGFLVNADYWRYDTHLKNLDLKFLALAKERIKSGYSLIYRTK